MRGRAALRIALPFLLPLLAINAAHAGSSMTGKDYTNFGMDLRKPIFPNGGTLALFKNQGDAAPFKVITNSPMIDLDDDGQACVRKIAQQEWVYCTVGRDAGWVKRASFTGPQEAAPVNAWPFRYWLYVASNGMGGEETHMLHKVLPRSPYLIKPTQFENVFFLSHFDREGNAISPKTGKKTGDRIFMIGSAVYLAPAEPQRRLRSPWLFLTFYNAELNALCPGPDRDSCHSAVNQHPAWRGVKAMYTAPANGPHEPLAQPGVPPPRWFGAQEVAFARHDDPVQAFYYRVPLDVWMQVDGGSVSEAQQVANRAAPFCLVDCKGARNPIVLEPAPGAF